MSYGEEKHKDEWRSVFDGVKTISVAPESLMADISAAIAALEYARASTFTHSPIKNGNKMADEAYKAGMVADQAVFSLNVALTNCRPEKKSSN